MGVKARVAISAIQVTNAIVAVKDANEFAIHGVMKVPDWRCAKLLNSQQYFKAQN